MKLPLFIVALLTSTVLCARDRLRMAVANGDTTYAQDPVSNLTTRYAYIEHMPECTVDIDSFIRQNLQYPTDAKAGKKQGRVVVSFTINKEGQVGAVHVFKPLYPSLDKEAIRLIQSLPA